MFLSGHFSKNGAAEGDYSAMKRGLSRGRDAGGRGRLAALVMARIRDDCAMHERLALRNCPKGKVRFRPATTWHTWCGKTRQMDEFDDCARDVGVQKILGASASQHSEDMTRGRRVADAKTDTLVKSVEDLLAEKEAVASREKELIEGLNAVLAKMGYQVVASAAVRRRPGRPPGSGNGRRQRKARQESDHPAGSRRRQRRQRRSGASPMAGGSVSKRRGRPRREEQNR
jgi:hypothetical protein